MVKIYKYALTISRHNIALVDMPIGAKILSIGEQHDQLIIWAEVDTNKCEFLEKIFVILETGRPVPDIPLRFIDTVQMESGLVWHVYEKTTNYLSPLLYETVL